jgi:hypothetical protein
VSVSAGGVITVMIMISGIAHVFFATSKDQQWGVSTWSIARYSESIALQGKLYILESATIYDTRQEILELDPPRHGYDGASSSFLPPKLVGTCPTDRIRGKFIIAAACDSEIVLIGYDVKPNSTNRLLVYRVSDIVMGKVEPVTSIGGKTLLLTVDNRSSRRGDDILVYLRERLLYMTCDSRGNQKTKRTYVRPPARTPASQPHDARLCWADTYAHGMHACRLERDENALQPAGPRNAYASIENALQA